MPHITLSPFASSYRYENHTLIEQNNSGTLLLSHREYDSSIFRYNLAFTLMPPPIDFSLCELDSVILELPVQRFRFHHAPLYNRILISTNSYSSTARLGIEISSSSFSNNCLRLDITSLLNQWNPNAVSLYKMMVSLELPNLSIRFRNQSVRFPQIQLDYHTISYNRFAPQSILNPSDTKPAAQTKDFFGTTSSNDNCYPANTPPPADSTNPSYIEVCSINSSNCFIEENGVFLFDSIDSASGISYSANTGLFSFPSSGIYYVDWMVYLRGTGSINWIKIALKNETTGEIFPFNSPCVIPGQICGQHLLHVEDVSYQYSLINSSEATLQLCYNSTNASLIIFKL